MQLWILYQSSDFYESFLQFFIVKSRERKVYKKLEPGSEDNIYDADGDGVVTDAELATTERLQALEIANEKADAQKNMCWFALFGMLLYPSGIVITSFLKLDQAASILGDIASVYFISVSGLIAAFFGFQSFKK